MKSHFLSIGLSCLSLFCGVSQVTAQTRVHAVTDLAHEFTFYSDHRFHAQYLPDQQGATNWCSLFNFDFANANLLILPGCADQIEYTNEDIKTIRKFLQDGGGVVLMGTHHDKSQNKLIESFGLKFANTAKAPLQGTSLIKIKDIEGQPGSYLEIEKKDNWKTLIADANGYPVMVRSKIGKGNLLVASRSLAGSNPNASDSINKNIWRPLLIDLASGKKIDPSKGNPSRGIESLEYTEKRDAFVLCYNDYLKPFAGAMVEISERCMPFIEKRMGVSLSPGMGSQIALLATGGGGFSSGSTIALAVWWGDFPKKEDSMIEFITHESVHSWVLPFPEVWNEPIATYVGNVVMGDMGHGAEGNQRIAATIQRARRHDPNMNLYDLSGVAHQKEAKQLNDGERNDIHWGKSYYILEELRKQDPNVIAKYFQAKRRYADPKKINAYGIDNTVLLLSHVMKKDLFGWFNDMGIPANRSKATIEI